MITSGRRGLILLGVLALFLSDRVFAQVNSWTNHGSGNWEDLSWSLGIRPAADQTIMLTNSGWKAIAVGSGTAQNFPQTMQVTTINMTAYTDSFNALLLNFAGMVTPFTPTTLNIGSNCSVTVLASALNVAAAATGYPGLQIGGALNQGAGGQVSSAGISIGELGPGVYNLTNGLLTVGNLLKVGTTFPGVFNQWNGSNSCAGLQLWDQGTYHLMGGSLTSTISLHGGLFHQTGGTFSGALQSILGGALMEGGMFSCPSGLRIPEASSPANPQTGGSFTQTGGTNLCGQIILGEYLSGGGSYTLSNGVLWAAGLVGNPGGTFSQSGGIHTNGGISLYGGEDNHGSHFTTFTVGGGFLTTPSMYLEFSPGDQTGGTNVVGEFVLNADRFAAFNLSGGMMQCSNATLHTQPGYTYSGQDGGGFFQSGGVHNISNLLIISRSKPNSTPGYPSPWHGYVLSGGQLNAKDIEVDGGSIFTHSGGTITQSGILTLQNGFLDEASVGAQLGRVQLNYGSATNSRIILPSGVCVLRFADSSSMTWSNQETLVVEHWIGSPRGNGRHRVIFGSSSTGLTAQQVTQLRFLNPNGVPGLFPATILSTGEIVPDQFLALQRSGNVLVLQWASGTLQTATNVTGPYVDLASATSPYTNDFSAPRRFFRIRE